MLGPYAALRPNEKKLSHWIVWGLWVFTIGGTRFVRRNWELPRIVLIVGWLFLGYWFATAR